jgi:hypothetical protein
MVSFVTTLSVEAVIIYVSSLQNLGIGAIGAVFLVALLIFVGMIINLTTGYLAHKRGEAGGWWTGIIGIAFWIVTLLPTVYGVTVQMELPGHGGGTFSQALVFTRNKHQIGTYDSKLRYPRCLRIRSSAGCGQVNGVSLQPPQSGFQPL